MACIASVWSANLNILHHGTLRVFFYVYRADDCVARTSNARRLSSMPLVEHLLLAEFDIDTGSTLRHAIPPLPDETDGATLAQLMLPEGGHLQLATSDYTAFYLPPASPDADSSPPRLCLSVVRTRLSSTHRRGAEMKALGVVSTAPFLDALRPLLLVALDAYWADPSAATLSRIRDALNASYSATGGDEGAMVSSRLQRSLIRGRCHVPRRSLASIYESNGGDSDGCIDAARTIQVSLRLEGDQRKGDGWEARVHAPRYLPVRPRVVI
jgi:hypothetical protein